MSFVIKTSKGYVKRTSNFGLFHGSIVLTDSKDDAYRFTRKRDAEVRAGVVRSRTKEADNEGRWYSQQGRDYIKFGGPLITEIEELT